MRVRNGESIEREIAQPPIHAALFGEFLGTALLIVLGNGVVAGVMLLGRKPDNMMITTGWGLAVALAVYVSGRLSGGHINPAVTLALAARRISPRPVASILGRATGGCVRRGVAGLR